MSASTPRPASATTVKASGSTRVVSTAFYWHRTSPRRDHLYVYYSVPNSLGVPTITPKMPGARGPLETEGKFRLSRFTLVGDTLDMASEEIILENPAEWFHCCHYGGEMEWLADGTMLLTVADDTISSQSNGGYSPRDYRPDHEYNNADLTSQNLADRRGKVLRLDPEDLDGNGSIVPADNPFLDNPDADPLVYAYGFRSDYRMAVDPLSQNTIVSTVGPDARFPNPLWGPAAHEELEIVPPGGGTNHGWPRCIANNLPYMDYTFTNGAATPGAPNSCAGMTPAAFYYTYQPSPTNPWIQMGQGGDCIIAGAVYRYEDDGALETPGSVPGQVLLHGLVARGHVVVADRRQRQPQHHGRSAVGGRQRDLQPDRCCGRPGRGHLSGRVRRVPLQRHGREDHPPEVRGL